MLILNPLNESASAFPILECLHIAGFVCGVGTAALVNLHLLGIAPNRSSPAEFWKTLMPWTLGGLSIAILAGLLLFSIDPEKYSANPAFRFKLVCLVLALAFYYTSVRRAAATGVGSIAASVSLTLWVLVPLGGVFIGFADSLSNAWSYAYPAVLWLHVVAFVVLGGLIIATDLRLLGLKVEESTTSEFAKALRTPKRCAFLVATVTGAVLLASKAGHFASVYSRWFWIKLALLGFISANYLLLRRGVFAGTAASQRAKGAAGLSLVLGMGVIAAARGPVTIKDIMHSMVDPSGDYLFQSVQTIADEHGTREKAPESDADWADVRARVIVLQEAPAILSADRRMAARPKDRSKNPAVEDEPWEIQELLDAQHPEFVRRAQRLQDAAAVAMNAVDAKDKRALLLSLDGIDKACESCHLHFWYPKDERAREAAKADGVLE